MKTILRFFMSITGIYSIKKLIHERNYYRDKLHRFSSETFEWVEQNCSDVQIQSYLLRKHMKRVRGLNNDKSNN